MSNQSTNPTPADDFDPDRKTQDSNAQPASDAPDAINESAAIHDLASRWIDGDWIDGGKLHADEVIAGNLPAHQAQLAELSLVDVLLEYLYRSPSLHGAQGLTTEQAVSSVLATIHDKSPHRGAAVSAGSSVSADAVFLATQAARHASHLTRGRLFTLCTSICLLLLVGGWALMQPPRPAVEATLRQLPQTVRRDRDVTYRAEIEMHIPFFGEPVKHRVATAYARAGQRFLIATSDGAFMFANLGDECWVMRKNGPVLVVDASMLLPPWLLYGRQRLSFLHIDAMLSRASLMYAFTMRDEERVEANFNDPNLIHYLGLRQGSDGRFPTQIDAWTDANTGVIRRIELSWKEPGVLYYLRRFTFVYAGELDLPEIFYQHETHRSDNQPVLHFRKLFK